MKLPSVASVTVPVTAVATKVAVRVVPPSTSVSFVSTFPPTAVSSAVVAVSLTATGPSFVPETVTFTVAVAEPPLPSPIV